MTNALPSRPNTLSVFDADRLRFRSGTSQSISAPFAAGSVVLQPVSNQQRVFDVRLELTRQLSGAGPADMVELPSVKVDGFVLDSSSACRPHDRYAPAAREPRFVVDAGFVLGHVGNQQRALADLGLDFGVNPVVVVFLRRITGRSPSEKDELIPTS